MNGLRVRREDIEDFEGSGGEDDYDDEDNDIEGTDEAQPSSPIAPSEKSPIFVIDLNFFVSFNFEQIIF